MADHRIVFLVIDMLVDFFNRDPVLSRQRTQLVRGINELARAFRRADQPVIWVRQEFKPDLSDAFLEMRRAGIELTIAGTEGCNLLPELERHHTDHVVIKKRYSAFFRTGLDALLTDLRAGTLVVCGINTHACVRTSVIDAYQRDYSVVLASQCIASYDPEHHEITVRYLDGKMSSLMSNEAVIDLLPRASMD